MCNERRTGGRKGDSDRPFCTIHYTALRWFAAVIIIIVPENVNVVRPNWSGGTASVEGNHFAPITRGRELAFQSHGPNGMKGMPRIRAGRRRSMVGRLGLGSWLHEHRLSVPAWVFHNIMLCWSCWSVNNYQAQECARALSISATSFVKRSVIMIYSPYEDCLPNRTMYNVWHPLKKWCFILFSNTIYGHQLGCTIAAVSAHQPVEQIKNALQNITTVTDATQCTPFFGRGRRSPEPSP